MTVRPCTSKFRFLLPPFKNAIILIYYVRKTLENREQNKGDFVTCKGYWCHLKIPNSNFPNSILHFKIQNKKHYRWETTHTQRPKSQRETESEPRKLKNVNFEKEKATRSPRAQQKHKAKWRNQQQWAPRNSKDFCLRTNERRKNQRKPWKNAKTWSHGPFSQAQGLHCSF